MEGSALRTPQVNARVELGGRLQRRAQQDVHLLIGSIGEIDVLLFRILREGNVPYGSVAERPFLDDLLLDEGAVRFEDLDAVVHAVADIEQTVVCKLGAVDRAAELLIDWCVRVVIAGVGVVRFVPIGAPMPLVLSGIGVEHDDALVAIPIGDVQFIRLRIDEHFRRSFQVFGVVAAFAFERMPDLHQEFSVLGKL